MDADSEITQELPIWSSPEREKPMLRILIVDDEENIRGLLITLIKESLFAKQIGSIEEAADGEEALELIKRNIGKFNVVITDGRMTKMGGLELAQNIKEMGENIAVGFLSTRDIDGHSLDDLDPQTQKELEEKYGITSISAKPLRSDQLPKFMNKLIDHVQAKASV